MVVNGVMASIGATTLGVSNSQLAVPEGILFNAYKRIYTLGQDSSSTAQLDIITENIRQYEKINDIGSVNVSALNRLGFATTLINGLDGYRYNTGLIGEANRITYGDPRDNSTYPGVAAAGAEINIQAPLVKRIQISLGVRVRTGVPFTSILSQVQSSVTAYINGSLSGQAIPIDGILNAANSVIGVFAVSISVPNFSTTNDVINVQPSEKALVINPSLDIQIFQVGS